MSNDDGMFPGYRQYDFSEYKKPTGYGYRFEKCFPVSDPDLEGFEVCAKVAVDLDEDDIPINVNNRIVYKKNGHRGEITCTHTAVYEGPLDDKPPDEDLARSTEAADMHDIRMKITPEEHFFSLSSYVQKIAESNLTELITTTYEGSEPLSFAIPFGFNDMMQQQTLNAISRVDADAARTVVVKTLRCIRDNTPEKWRKEVFERFDDIMNLEKLACTSIENFRLVTNDFASPTAGKKIAEYCAGTMTSPEHEEEMIKTLYEANTGEGVDSIDDVLRHSASHIQNLVHQDLATRALQKVENIPDDVLDDILLQHNLTFNAINAKKVSPRQLDRVLETITSWEPNLRLEPVQALMIQYSDMSHSQLDNVHEIALESGDRTPSLLARMAILDELRPSDLHKIIDTLRGFDDAHIQTMLMLLANRESVAGMIAPLEPVIKSTANEPRSRRTRLIINKLVEKKMSQSDIDMLSRVMDEDDTFVDMIGTYSREPELQRKVARVDPMLLTKNNHLTGNIMLEILHGMDTENTTKASQFVYDLSTKEPINGNIVRQLATIKISNDALSNFIKNANLDDDGLVAAAKDPSLRLSAIYNRHTNERSPAAIGNVLNALENQPNDLKWKFLRRKELPSETYTMLARRRDPMALRAFAAADKRQGKELAALYDTLKSRKNRDYAAISTIIQNTNTPRDVIYDASKLRGRNTDDPNLPGAVRDIAKRQIEARRRIGIDK